LNLIRQLEKIHDLGYARPGNPLSGGYFRLSHPGIVIQFSPPRLRQHKRMDARFRYFGFVLIGRGEAFKNVGRERDWMENKRLVTPTGKGYSNGQTELPESSGFARASGAIRLGLRPRSWRAILPKAESNGPEQAPARRRTNSLSVMPCFVYILRLRIDFDKQLFRRCRFKRVNLVPFRRPAGLSGHAQALIKTGGSRE